MELIGNEIDQERVDRQAQELLDAYLKTYYDTMAEKAEQVMELEDLLSSLQASIELLANMAVTASTILHAGADKPVCFDEIIQATMIDVRKNLDDMVADRSKVIHAYIPMSMKVQ